MDETAKQDRLAEAVTRRLRARRHAAARRHAERSRRRARRHDLRARRLGVRLRLRLAQPEDGGAGGNISFLDGAREGERLVATARESSSKGRSGVYLVTVTGGDGRVVAEMQGLSRTVGGAVVEQEPS